MILDATFVRNYINTSVLQFFEFSFLIGAIVVFSLVLMMKKLK
jgi:hypothetical protein